MTAPLAGETALLRPAPASLAGGASAQAQVAALPALDEVPQPAWRDLHAQAIEPNAYSQPLWALAVAQLAPGRSGAKALIARHPSDTDMLIGFLPVRSAWHAFRIPVRSLVGWMAYAPLCVPTLHRDHAAAAARELLAAARASGAHSLFLPAMAAEGAAFEALRQAARELGCGFQILRSHRRAALDARTEPEAMLRRALGTKKLKELRRQRHRLEDKGVVTFDTASTPAAVRPALEQFLQLEASGWKGRAGTAMLSAGEADFIRQAGPALAEDGRFQVMSLTRKGSPVASGLILRDRERAYFFKIAFDETEARNSPGVQLAVDVTRALCADPEIALADSTADANHAMIDPIWRGRIVMADVFIALAPASAMAAITRALLQWRCRGIGLYRRLRRSVSRRG